MLAELRHLFVLALGTAACGSGGDKTPPANSTLPGAAILSPMPGIIAGDSVTVQLGATGVTIVPASGTAVSGEAHHHLFVDVDVTPDGEPIPTAPGIHHLGDGRDTVRIALGPGSHRLIAVLATGDHVPLAGARRDTIRVEGISPD